MGWINEVSLLTQDRKDHVIVTLVDITGSAPQVVASKMIVTADGLHHGTIGGGKIESHCIEHARKLLSEKSSSRIERWNLQKDIGMTCGGEMSFFFDCNTFSNWTIAIFGAGHVSQELIRVLSTWTCQVRVFDSRKEWVEKLIDSPNVVKKVSENLAEEVGSLPEGAYLLSMTQGHSSDVPVLKEALSQKERFSFIGVIGSTVKASRIKSELKEWGVSMDAIEELVCPIGLDFGNNTPPEISISIAAQLLTLKDQNEEEK